MIDRAYNIIENIKLSVGELKNRKDVDLLKGNELIFEIEENYDSPERLVEIFHKKRGDATGEEGEESIWSHETRLRNGEQKSLFDLFGELEREVASW